MSMKDASDLWWLCWDRNVELSALGPKYLTHIRREDTSAETQAAFDRIQKEKTMAPTPPPYEEEDDDRGESND